MTSTSESTNGVLTACPGDRISITCTHNVTAGTGLTRWELPGVSLCLVVHDGSAAPNCAPFTITMISDDSGLTVSSTVVTVTDRALDGETIECRAGTSITNSPLVGSVNIGVLCKFICCWPGNTVFANTAIPTPSITLVEQASQYMANLSLSVDNTRCAATYVVNATQDGDSGSVSGGSSSTTLVTVNGLDLCRYDHSFVGYVITAGGSVGDMSAPPFSFTANLSGMYNLMHACMFTPYLSLGLNGVANVITNSERTVLQWDQMPNTGYPDCITSYSIGWNGTTYNTSDTAISVTRELLSATGFPFCTTTSVTVTPVTPMRLLAGRGSTSDVILISPGINNQMYNICITFFHRFRDT